MDKKEAFKAFAKNHKELITYLENNPNMTWQKLYEIYDIYGEDETTWEPYLSSSKSSTNINDVLKQIDMNKMKEHINTAQKALNLIKELTTKGAENISSVKGPTIPRPLTKFFGD